MAVKYKTTKNAMMTAALAPVAVAVVAMSMKSLKLLRTSHSENL